MTLRAGFLWTMIGSLALAAALGVAALMLPALFPKTSHILATALVVAGASLLCLACAAAVERGRVIPIAWTGIVTSVGAAVVWLIHIWSFGAWDAQWSVGLEILEQVGATLQTTAVWAAVLAIIHMRAGVAPRFRWPILSLAILFSALAASTIVGIWFNFDWWWIKVFGAGWVLVAWTIWVMLLMLIQCRRRASRIVNNLTIGVGTILTGLILLMIWEIVNDDEVVVRSLSALIILTACGTVVVPILALIDRQSIRDSAESIASRVVIDLTCPRCGAGQSIRAGRDTCRACGLRIEINVEEPRCACGYLTYQLESDHCPECGRAIPAKERWATAAEPGGAAAPRDVAHHAG